MASFSQRGLILDEAVDASPAGDDDTTLEDAPEQSPGVMQLELLVRDPEVIRALSERPGGRQRHEFALDALRIGVMALRHAGAQFDADAVRNVSTELLDKLQNALEQHAKHSQERTTGVLKEYFDPKSGRLSERVGQLVSDKGELATMLRGHLASEGSPLAKTLETWLGKESPLMRQLDPEHAKGLIKTIQDRVEGELAKQRDKVLGEFSLDNREGALRRLVDELTSKHGDLSKNLQGKIDEVIKEFSLDKEDSALNRLVGNVDRAQRTISSEFSLDNEQSALSRLKNELTTILSAHVKTNAEFQEEVKVTLAKLSQKRESDARSPEHGNIYEEAVLAFITEDGHRRGDLVEATGNTVGVIKNCKVGDAVIELSPDSAAAGCRIVVEAKGNKQYSTPKARDELETACKNRQADVGVFVFSPESSPLGDRPLARFSNSIFVAWDAEDTSTDPYLMAALEIARACAVEFHRGAEAEEVDWVGIDKAIAEIEKRAENLDKIGKPAESIKSASEKIIERVRVDQDALHRQVASLRAKLSAVRSAGD